MHEALKVYLKDSFVGWLSHETRGDAFSFRYEPRYLEAPAEGALSFALPLSDEAFDTERTYGFFANLLPPAAVRQRLGASLHLSRNNVFGFLRAIGGDCAGAVSLHPEGARPTPQDVERTRELSEEEAVAILRSLRRRPLYAAGEAGYRYSGAGAQDKLIARVKDDRVILPLYGTPSTHIVKPPADGFPDSVENEFFCERLATALGLAAARCDILVLGGGRHYVSERYDRETVGGRPRRLHQEDFCQLLSVDPESKYEEDGGPTIPQCLDVLRRMRMPAPGQLAFLDAVAFNYLIGNADAHAKNHSVVYRGGAPVFAPLYDLVCTAVYPELSRESAMRIGGDAAFERISRDSFARMGEACRISPRLALDRLDALAAKILPAARTLAEACADSHPSPVYSRIVDVIAAQTARVAKP